MGFQAIPGSYIARGILCNSENQVYDEAADRYYDLRSPQTLVMIFDRQVNERIFEPVDVLLNRGNDYLLPSLSLLISYIEYIGRLKCGRVDPGNSGKIFKTQFAEMFPEFSKNERKTLHKDLRCGFAHVAMTRNGILVQYEEPNNIRPIVRDRKDNLYRIYCRSLYMMFMNHHNQYRQSLDECVAHGASNVILENFLAAYKKLINIR